MASASSLFDKIISVLPAPGQNYFSLTIDLNTLTPSSIALSTSSKRFLVLPLKIMVLSLQSSVFLLKTTNFSDAIYSTQTSSDSPIYSGVGASNFDKIVALIALATLLNSNLLRIRTTKILYLSKKWRMISEIVPPPRTTFTFAATSFCTNFYANYY